jgi:hypothetical protein
MNLSKALKPGIIRWETDVSFVDRCVCHAAKQDHLEGNYFIESTPYTQTSEKILWIQLLIT